MTGVNHQSNAKRDSACIFYKETLGVCVVTLLNLSEWIICEVSIQSNKRYLLFQVIFLLDLQPSETYDETITEGIKLEYLTNVHGFDQFISQPTCLMPESSFSFGLIFTDYQI